MKIEVAALVAVLGLILAACQISETDQDLTRLAQLMAGTFESTAGPEPQVLFIAPIWVEREAGYWFYVERALSVRAGRPYEQRVYRLDRDDEGELFLEPYSLPDPGSVVGLWRNPDRLDEYAPSDLESRAGCTLYLRGTGHYRYTGSTRGRSCAPTSTGAAYATIDLTIGTETIEMLERDFDENGGQVHGPDRPHRLERR